MAIDKDFVTYVAEQMDDAIDVSYRMMFGAYSIYSNGKVVGIVGDQQLFVKPTDAGRSFIGDVVEAPPYPGAKNFFLIGDKLDDRKWLSQLIILTEQELPTPKKRKKKKERSSPSKDR